MEPVLLMDDPLPRVRRLTLNRPEKRNALNDTLRQALFDALRAADDDREVSAVIIRGAGPCFSAGYDLGERNTPVERHTATTDGWWARHVVAGWFELWDMATPLIAQVHGWCLAGGSELATGCDLVYVADDARIGYPAVRSMSTPDLVWQPWLLGFRRGMEALLTGDAMTGTEAAEGGFATRSYPAASLEDEVLAVAARLVEVPFDLLTLNLEPWARIGAHGAIALVKGRGDFLDTRVVEMAPGRSTDPQRHLFEEVVYVLEGRGSTTIEAPDGARHSFEWGPRSLFALPLNARYRHFNTSGRKPARFVATSNLPLVLKAFHNLDFVFANPFAFPERFGPQEHFHGEGSFIPMRPGRHMWETDFVPDLGGFELQEWRARGAVRAPAPRARGVAPPLRRAAGRRGAWGARVLDRLRVGIGSSSGVSCERGVVRDEDAALSSRAQAGGAGERRPRGVTRCICRARESRSTIQRRLGVCCEATREGRDHGDAPATRSVGERDREALPADRDRQVRRLGA